MNARYQAIVLLSEGVNPDDAPDDVWVSAFQRAEVPAQPVHPIEGPEPTCSIRAFEGPEVHDAPGVNRCPECGHKPDARIGEPIDLGTYL